MAAATHRVICIQLCCSHRNDSNYTFVFALSATGEGLSILKRARMRRLRHMATGLPDSIDNIRAPSRLLWEVLLANSALAMSWKLISPAPGACKLKNITSVMTAECACSLLRIHSQAGWRDFSWRSRILIWLQSPSLGEATGSEQMAIGIWRIIARLGGQFVMCVWFRATPPSFS